jgi:transcriptional regulator with XRE-family HTH domain
MRINSLGFNLRRLRSEYNVTVQQISETTGISIYLINKYEADSIFPKKEDIEMIAKYYGVEISKILIGD